MLHHIWNFSKESVPVCIDCRFQLYFPRGSEPPRPSYPAPRSKLQYLNSDAHKHAVFKERSAKELMAQTPQEELQERANEVEFGVAMCAVTILR